MITSLQNSLVKQIVRLRERREREETSLFLIEGYREILRALDAGRKMEKILFCPSFFLKENEPKLLERIEEKIPCSKEVFQKISYRDRPDGLLAIARQQHRGLDDLVLKPSPFLLIAERIEKPGNLGTILRSADAAGVDAVIVADPTTDIHNPNVVRSSVGTLFTVPVIEAKSEEIFPFLEKHHIALVAATPHASVEFTRADLSGSIAIAVGAEQYGLSPSWLERAQIRIQIPMHGAADSLNVASATTLLLYEALRQRNPL